MMVEMRDEEMKKTKQKVCLFDPTHVIGAVWSRKGAPNC